MSARAAAYRIVMILNLLAALAVLLYLERVHRILNYVFGDVDSYQQFEHRVLKVSGILTVLFSPVLIPLVSFDSLQSIPYRNLVGLANLVWIIFPMTFLLTLWLRDIVSIVEEMQSPDVPGESE